MVPTHIMGNLILPKDSTGTKRSMKLHFILYWRIVLLEPYNTVLCPFGPLKSSRSQKLVYTYQILTENILLKKIF